MHRNRTRKTKQTGSSTIIVSNGDLSGAVSVIVNRDTESFVAEPAADSTEAENTSEQIFDENTDVSETPVISEQMLYELYTAGRSMKVTGDGYSIIIDGKKIVNYKNELNTDIELERAGDCIKFNLIDGEYLCGEVTLHIDDVKERNTMRYTFIKQHDATDCAAACMGMVCLHYSFILGFRSRWIISCVY